MGYFNYFVKQFIRLFTKKFFWVILIVVAIIFCKNFVFADTLYDFRGDTYYCNTDELPQAVLNTVKSFPQFNDPNYSIMIYYYSSYPYACIISDSGEITYDLYNIGGGHNNKFILTGRHVISWYGIDADGTINSVGNTESVYQYSENYIKFLYLNRSKCYILSNNDFLDPNYIFTEHTTPYITNTETDVNFWSFDYLNIDLGNYDPYYTYIDSPVLRDFVLQIDVDGVVYDFNINSYFNSTRTAFNIPKQILSNYFVIRSGTSIDFNLIGYARYDTDDSFSLGSYTLSLTSSEQDIINQDSDKYQLGSLVSGQQQIIESQQQINDTLTDSSIDNITSDTLPTDNTTDITREGINGIFTSIYNAFCVGQPQDIIFPIPFTNKSITLSPSYVYDNLNSIGASFIILLIQAFWWYIISRFIIKDIADKMNKIKSGNIERIENSNIKGDML